MKRYAEHYEKVFQFAEYGDYENFFIRLGYVVEEKEFKSMLGSPLVNITALNGRPIFKNDNIDKSKYLLLNEELSPLSGGLLSVKELYGFAPNLIYTTYGAEPVNIFGLEDPSGYLRVSINTSSTLPYPNSWDPSEGTFTLSVSSGDFSIGDMVKAELVGSGNYYYDANSPEVPIIEVISSTQIKVSQFGLNFISYDGQPAVSYGYQQTINILNHDVGGVWQGARYLVRDVSTRLPSTEITNTSNEISFHLKPPALERRYIVSSGNAEVDTITDSTTPNTSTWKSMVASNTLIVCEDATLEVVFPQTFYKKTIKKVLCR